MFGHIAFALILVLLVPSWAQAQEEPPAPSEEETVANPAEPPPLPMPPQPATEPETPTPTAKAAPTLGEISLEEWKRDDWMLLKPSVSLFELDGYFRVRMSSLHKMDFGNGAVSETDGQGGDLVRYPANADGSADYTGSNMRLRLEPVIHAAEGISIHTSIDVFDNLVLGSTTNAAQLAGQAPLDILSLSQESGDGVTNALTNSVRVRSVYGRVTALNEQLDFRFGRMPNHWGLGMLFNGGDCLDCDYEQVSDRAAVSFRMADHIFGLLYDWVGSGPVLEPFGDLTGQAVDAFSWDDTAQYSLQVMHVDHPQDVQDQVLAGNTVFNYGMWNILRKQARGLPASYYADRTNQADGTDYAQTMGTANSPSDYFERRDATLYIGDAFVRLYHGAWELTAEGAVIYGNFSDKLTTEADSIKTDVMQIGAALELKYNLERQLSGAVVALKAGGATGDTHTGYGALNAAVTQRGSSDSSSTTDTELNNFQFSPDYHVDMLLFRRILGTVTGAWYVRPELEYNFDKRVSGTIAAIYSQAIHGASTARCYDVGDTREPCDGTTKEAKLPLGLELNAELTFATDPNPEGGSFIAALKGGVLFPLGAFDLSTADAEVENSFPWMIQTSLGITF